jgi:hypothetical protein
VLRRGNDEQTVAPPQSLAEIAAHVSDEKAVILAVELNEVLFRLRLFEKLGTLCHDIPWVGLRSIPVTGT